MAPLLHCRKHQMLRSGISWKCLCRSMSALGTSGRNWVTESTCHRWYSVDVEWMCGRDQLAVQGDDCSSSAPTTTVVAVDETIDKFNECTEPGIRNSRHVLKRKGSLGSLTSGNLSSPHQEQSSRTQSLRRCFSAFYTTRDVREVNVDGATRLESPMNYVQGVLAGEDESLDVLHKVRNINDILSGVGSEDALEQLEVQFSTRLVNEVIRRQTDVNKAFQFFNWVQDKRDFQHSGRTYKVMIHKLMNTRNFKGLKLETLRQVINQCLADGFSPGVTIHTYLIDAYCQVGRIEEAREHMNVMEKQGCSPNVVTYSALINGFIRASRVNEALRVLEEMEVKNCEPNVVTYSALIHGLVKNMRMREAWILFEKMKMKGCAPNLITYCCLIDGLAKAGQFEEIFILLEEMRQVGCRPNVFIYGTLINYCVKVGTLDRAWGLFARMKEDGLVPNLFIFTPIVSSLGKAGEWEQAQLLLDEMRACGCYPDVIAYSGLIAGLVKAGKWMEACKVLGDMERYGCPPNEKTYSSLIAGLVDVGEIAKAQSLLEDMVAKGWKPSPGVRKALEKKLAAEPVEV